MQKIRRTEVLVNPNSIGVYNLVSNLPDDIIIDILSRLPVKPLMRFKSVCKGWLFLIKRDTNFIDLHFSRSRPNLLIINQIPGKSIIFSTNLDFSFGENKSFQHSNSCAEIVEARTGGIQDKRKPIECYYPTHFLESVNGLLCFVDWRTHAIRIYNASTREATPWVKSTLVAEENDNHKLANEGSMIEIKRHRYAIYQFGFDPVRKEYKVFCFWRLTAKPQGYSFTFMDRHDYECWEAFTVGRDTKWRRINAVPNDNNQIKIKVAIPSDNCHRPQVYADGTLYWINRRYYWDRGMYSNHDDPAVIVAFDVGSEKYRVIPIPKFIPNSPISMLVLGSHVALLYRMERYVLKLWMFDDAADKKLGNCQGNGINWSSETINIPFRCEGRATVGVSTIPESTDMILFEYRRLTSSVSFDCLYAYDRRTKTCRKIEMDGVPCTLHSERSSVRTFTESLFPVQPSQQGESFFFLMLRHRPVLSPGSVTTGLSPTEQTRPV